MIWAYLGPLPAPLIPRLDGFVVDGAIRLVGRPSSRATGCRSWRTRSIPSTPSGCTASSRSSSRNSEARRYAISRHHLKIAFEEFEYGIYKRRLLEGQTEDADDWTVGHPIVFPYTLAVGQRRAELRAMYAFQIRVPMDDTHTLHLLVQRVRPAGRRRPCRRSCSSETSAFYDVPFVDEDGEYLLDMHRRAGHHGAG